jgi:HSP90 family molecular chaperone
LYVCVSLSHTHRFSSLSTDSGVHLCVCVCRYDVAALASGYSIEDPSAFAERVNSLMSSGAVPMPEPRPAQNVDAEVVE